MLYYATPASVASGMEKLQCLAPQALIPLWAKHQRYDVMYKHGIIQLPKQALISPCYYALAIT